MQLRHPGAVMLTNRILEWSHLDGVSGVLLVYSVVELQYCYKLEQSILKKRMPYSRANGFSYKKVGKVVQKARFRRCWAMNKSVRLSGAQLAVSLYEQGDELTIVASSPSGERYDCHVSQAELMSRSGDTRLSHMEMLEKQVLCEELCKQLELIPGKNGPELVLKVRVSKRKGKAEAKESGDKDQAKDAKGGDAKDSGKPPSLLGDLPALFSTSIDLAVSPSCSDSKQESKSTRIKNIENAPEHFKCAITHQCMDEPMKSPYGDVFEKGVIIEWLGAQGQICPITGKTLQKEQLEPHTKLRQEISQWHIQQAMSKAGAKEEGKADEEDEYDF
jgi:hypothetical protein